VAVVDVLMPWQGYRLGGSTIGGNVGPTDASTIAVYIYLIYFSATLMTESFYTAILLWPLRSFSGLLRQRGNRETQKSGSLPGA